MKYNPKNHRGYDKVMKMYGDCMEKYCQQMTLYLCWFETLRHWWNCNRVAILMILAWKSLIFCPIDTKWVTYTKPPLNQHFIHSTWKYDIYDISLKQNKIIDIIYYWKITAETANLHKLYQYKTFPLLCSWILLSELCTALHKGSIRFIKPVVACIIVH